MAGSRSRWWVHKDAARVLARAEASSGTVTSTAELVYLHGFCALLLTELLPLADGDRERLRLLYAELQRTLSERTVAPNGRETAGKERDG
jgi:hypothetical protein